MKAVTVAVLVLTGLIGCPIQSKASPLMENIAALAVATRWCKDYTVDLESGIKLALSQGINPLKPPHNKSFEETKEKLEGYLADLGVKQWCTVTYNRYKPGGPVPGFMIKN